MSLNLVKRYLKDRWVSATIFGVSLLLYCWMMVVLMPAFLTNVGYQKMVEEVPQAFMTVFSGESTIVFNPEGFLSAYFFALWWPIIVGSFAIAAATAIVAKEIDEGTMDFLLSQPITRTNLILSRFWALSIYLFVLTAVTFGGTWLLAPLYKVELNLKGLLTTGVLGLAFVIAISSFSLLFSLILRERNTAIVASLFLFIGTHLLNALSGLNETLGKFRFLSFFKYYRPSHTLATGELPLNDLSVFLAVIAVCLALSLIIFGRKDIKAA